MKKIDTLLCYNDFAKKICGENKIIDLLLSRFVLDVPYHLYIDLCFYDVPWRKRKKYILDHAAYALKFNPGVTRTNHDDKRELIKMIYPYLKRKVIMDTSSMDITEFASFCEGIDSFFYKPEDGDGGGWNKKILFERL